MHYLPCQHILCFGLHRLLHFCQFTYIFEFEHVCICFIPLFHIFPSQCAPIGSLERPWTTTQKGWSHYLDVQRATLVPICLSAYIHVCSALPYKIHLTQFRFNWSEKTPYSPTVAFEACYASITLTTSSFQSNLQIGSVNRRRYGRSSQSSLKIPSSNLEQSLHLASLPSATLTFPPLLTALSLLFLTPPTPTPILTLQTTFTTPTLLHQPQPLSPLSHPLYPPNNYAWKRQKKTLLPQHPQPPPQQLQPPHLSTHPHLLPFPRNHVPKGQNYPTRSSSQRDTHLHSVHLFPLISG